MIEPVEFGAGAIYCTSQPGYLRLNTIASQVTAYPDDTVVSSLPGLKGPTLYEWSRTPHNGVAVDSYPSRPHTGRYFAAVFRELLQRIPPTVTIECHCAAAAGMEQAHGDEWVVHLSNGHELRCDAVVLAIGCAASARTDPAILADEFCLPQSVAEKRIIARPFPIDGTLSRLEPGKNVGVIGLGLTALDIIRGCTVGRGGKFLREQGRLRYVRSGDEPHIVAWSRCGLPLMARGVNQKPIDEKVQGRFLTDETLDKLRSEKLRTSGTAKLDFGYDVLPLLVQEMAHAYETAAALQHGEAVHAPSSSAENSPAFQWAQLTSPVPSSALRTENKFKSFFLDYLRWDIAEAHRGNIGSPVKSACDIIRDLRDRIRYAVEFGGLTPDSHRIFVTGFTPLHNRLAVGPPVEAIEELQALVEAGVVDPYCGPQPRLQWDSQSGRLSLHPTAFRGASRELSVVVNARIPPTDVATTAYPFVRNLLEGGYIVPFENALLGTVYRPGGIAVTQSYKVINKHARAYDNLFAVGAITEGCTWYSQVLARPYVNSRSMRDAASVVQSLYEYFAGRDKVRVHSAEVAVRKPHMTERNPKSAPEPMEQAPALSRSEPGIREGISPLAPGKTKVV
jgi:uncharacterized NAD(P)/FAD-binding protein YdhS